jgi:hypothetical protein
MKALPLIGLIALAMPDFVWADARCDQTYGELKRLEAENIRETKKLTDNGLVAIGPGKDICDRQNIEYQETRFAYAKKVATLAQAFLEACRSDESRAQEVKEYSLPGILNPQPPTIRHTCEVLGR